MRADLKLHVIAGIIIAIATYLVVPFDAVAKGIAAVIAAIVIGAAKEWIWDKSGRGNVDKKDFEYTVYGGIVGAVVCFAVGALL